MAFLKVIPLLVFLVACSEGKKEKLNLPTPEWFSTANYVELNSVADIDTLWRSKQRCCIDEDKLLENNREFYRSCYGAISRNPENDHIVVKCLRLMDSGSSLEKVERAEIKRYLVNNYWNHKDSVSGCANCAPADTVARVTRDLAWYERSVGMHEVSIQRIEKLLDERRSEISLWVQVELYEVLGHLYVGSAITGVQKERMKEAFERISPVRDNDDIGVKRRFSAFDNIYQLVILR